MSDAQYIWTPITVDDVVINETYVRATHRANREVVTEGLVTGREHEYLEIRQEDGRVFTVDTDFRDLLQRREAAPTFRAPVVGETFTRGSDRGPDRENCVVSTVADRGDGWRVEYRSNGGSGGRGTIIVHPDGRITSQEGLAPGRFIRPEAPGEWVQATRDNVQVGSLIKGAPARIGGLIEARVTSLTPETADFRAATLVVHEPSSNGHGVDMSGGPLGSGYVYHFQDVQVWTGDVAPSQPPVTWHPIEFAQIQNGDTVRATFTDSRGRTTVREGRVTALNGARVQIREASGDTFRATSLRSFEISNRVPDAVKPISDRYPTIHHLRAAIFDVVRANRASGDWCSEAHDFVAELGIASGVDDAAIRDQADEVQALVTKLQGETAGGRGITSSSLVAAFETLGIPRTGTPKQKMMTISVAVPLDMTPSQVQDYISNLNNITVEQVEES